jgi:hypothetical protein
MRASKSSNQCWIFCFNSGGTIWRTGTLGQFAALKHPAGRHQNVMRECCGKPKALLRLGTSVPNPKFAVPSSIPLSELRIQRNTEKR